MNFSHWENPSVLYGLWVLPVLGWLWFRGHRKRLAAARQFADSAMVPRLMPSLSGPRPWIKATLLLLGVSLVIAAMTRPRFGVEYHTVRQHGLDVFVALDVSRSMTARDVAPSRLERAKLDIQDLLEHLVGDRVGLVVFAGKAVVKVPLTSDYGFFRMVLEQIDTTSAPRGGTLIGDAIRRAVEAMPPESNRDRVVVLITDGGDQDSYPQEAAGRAAAAGIKIFTVGLGDAEQGAVVPNVEYQGRPVESRLDERLLKQIALATGGAYIPAGTRAYDLGEICKDHLAGLTRGDLGSEQRKRFKERFQLFLGLGIALLLAEMAIPAYPRGPREQPGSGVLHRAGKAAGVLLAIALLAPAARARSPDVAGAVARGLKHYRAGDYPSAVKAFRDADVARPDDPWITYNLATAQAAAGDAKKAQELFEKAALARDPGLAARCRYNLGTLAAAQARAVFGEKPEEATPEVRQQGLGLLAQAVAHYRGCLELDPDHADARHNLELIRLWIKYMQAMWEERDRKEQRDQMDLLPFLAMIEARQRELRATTRSLVSEADSPRRRQAVSESASGQRKLQEEIQPLKEKIEQALQPPSPPGATGSPPQAPGADRHKAIQGLDRLADQAGSAMLAAADALDQTNLDDAAGHQEDAVGKLDPIYSAVVPFASLVQRAVTTQQGLVDQVAPAVEKPEKPPAAGEPAPDLDEVAWNQKFVAGWARIMGPKAEEDLKQLENAPQATTGPGGQAPAPPTGADTEAPRQSRDALQKALEKAIQLAPQVEQLATGAVNDLQQAKPAHALPKQEEALKLLKEIADALPKQDQKQQGKQNQDQDQKPKQNEQARSGQDQKQRAPRRQQDLSRQQAEALLKKVRERQRDRRQLEKEVQGYLMGPRAVEKDW